MRLYSSSASAFSPKNPNAPSVKTIIGGELEWRDFKKGGTAFLPTALRGQLGGMEPKPSGKCKGVVGIITHFNRLPIGYY